MTAHVHPFDVPLNEPIEGFGDSGPAPPVEGTASTVAPGPEEARLVSPAPAPDGDDVLEGEVDRQEGEPEEQQVDRAEVHAEGGEQPDGGREDGEESHAGHVPAQRPVDPIQLRRALTSWCDGLTTFDDRAVGLHQVLEAALALGDIEHELTERLAEEISGPWVETPAGILQRATRGGHVSWDAEAIWPEALDEARRRAADPETGELSAEADRGARAMLDVVREILSGPSFRVKQLKDIGVDPDEVRATAPKRRIVKFA